MKKKLTQVRQNMHQIDFALMFSCKGLNSINNIDNIYIYLVKQM